MENTEWSTPALLRHARATYANAMRQALEEAGYGDLPSNGLYVIGALAQGGDEAALGDIIRGMQMSKQATGQLVDSLVARGYLTRATDEDDRRKLTVKLSERGRDAAIAQWVGRGKIDAALLAEVGPEAVSTLRRGLAVLSRVIAALDFFRVHHYLYSRSGAEFFQ